MWEQFKRTAKPSPKDPTVTLSANGIIGLNTAVAKNIIGDSKYALLFFDRERHLMGMKFVKQNDPDAYPVKLSPSNSHGSVAGISFLKSYNIFPKETAKYPAVFDEKEKMLTVDLSGAPGGKKKGKN